MSIEDRYQYDATMEQIMFNLEQLIADIMLTTIKRIAGEYQETTQPNQNQSEDEPF